MALGVLRARGRRRRRVAVTAAGAPARVLVAHPSPDLYGSDRMLLESVRALVAAGADVCVTVPTDGPLLPALRAAGARVLLVDTVVLRKALLRPRALAGLVIAAARALPRAVHAVRTTRADVVLVNTLTLPMWLLAARLAGRPAVCHVHEAEAGLPRPVAAVLHLPLLLAGRLLVNSRAAGALVADALPGLRGRVRLLPNGVPGPVQDAVAVREALVGPVRLVLVGRLAPRKGTDLAVRAVAELVAGGVDAELELVGDVFPGYEWYSDELRRLVEELGLQRRVHFCGFQADVWPALARADVVLVPSRAEPFGNVAVEAGLARRPVVAAAVQGLSEIVDDGRTGVLVRPDDPAALASGVRRLVDDWPGAVATAQRAHDDVAERFSRAAYADRLVAALAEATAQD